MTKMGKKKKKGLVAALCVIAVIVLLAAAYGIFCLIIEDDKIWADASVNGVNIQGMSKKEAAQTVEQKFEEDYKDTAVTVELDGQQYTMNVFPMLGMDASAEIEKAYEKGHGNLLVRGLEWVEMKRERQRNFPMMCSRLWPIQMRWKELYRHPAFRITTPCRILHMK